MVNVKATKKRKLKESIDSLGKGKKKIPRGRVCQRTDWETLDDTRSDYVFLT